MKERIVKVRKHFKLTQEKFGEILNIAKSTVQSLEYGHRDITDRTIADICREFKVNETWLRTGEGEMFAPTTQVQRIASITATLAQQPEDSLLLSYIETLCELPIESLERNLEFAKALLENVEKKQK